MAIYYIDNTNGNDAHDGTREPTETNHTASDYNGSTTDATNVWCDDLVSAVLDFYNGDYLYNLTRSAGAIVLDYDPDDGGHKHITLTGPGITGQDAGDEFYVIKAWETIQQFTGNSRSAGDTGKVRAEDPAQIHDTSAADITTASAGSANNLITLKGCTSTDDPWGDDSDVRPILDFDDANFQLKVSHDHWKLENLDLYRSGDAAGAFRSTRHGTVINNCIARNSNLGFSGECLYTNCTAHNNTNPGFYVGQGLLDGCVSYSNKYGVSRAGMGLLSVRNTTFGVGGANTTADINMGYAGEWQFQGRNVKLASTTEVAGMVGSAYGRPQSYIRIEDDEQTHLAYRAWYVTGYVSSTTSVVRTGGAPFSMLVEPASICSDDAPLYGIGHRLEGFPIYLTAAETTITVYAKTADWAARPSATEFYIELDYNDGAASWARKPSTESFSDDNWTAFTVTVTANAAGFAYLKAILKDYESGAKIYIDAQPVLS